MCEHIYLVGEREGACDIGVVGEEIRMLPLIRTRRQRLKSRIKEMPKTPRYLAMIGLSLCLCMLLMKKSRQFIAQSQHAIAAPACG